MNAKEGLKKVVKVGDQFPLNRHHRVNGSSSKMVECLSRNGRVDKIEGDYALGQCVANDCSKPIKVSVNVYLFSER